MDATTARALLGVHPSADADEIKRAFRRLARTAHPDHGGTGAEFRRLLDAQRTALTHVPPDPISDGRSASGRGRAAASWVTGTGPRSSISIVDAPRTRRARCPEAGSPERSFGDILARHLAAA